MIETQDIKIPGKQMAGLLFLYYGIPWLIVCLIIFGIFILTGFIWDYKFFFLALIWIFLLIPMLIGFLYFYHGLKPLTVLNSVNHKIIFSPKNIEVRILPIQDKEEKKDLLSERKVCVNLEKFSGVRLGENYAILLFHDIGWLWIPVNGFDTVSDFKSVISLLGKYSKDE